MAERSFTLNRTLILALAIPILVILGRTVSGVLILQQGVRYTFRVEGYDPRDLIAGHYVRFRVVFPEDLCPSNGLSNQKDRCFCLTSPGPEPEGYGIDCEKLDPQSCKALLKGSCTPAGKFQVPKLDRFYVPEDRADDFDREVRNRGAQIIVAIRRNGDFRTVDLLPEK